MADLSTSLPSKTIRVSLSLILFSTNLLQGQGTIGVQPAGTAPPAQIAGAAAPTPQQPAKTAKDAKDDKPAQPKSYPVVVTPGTPSIWSMEQAHYLLNRLRANNDSIQTNAPSSGDLDPNSTNALRLDALQTTLNVSAALDGVTGLQNQIALKQFTDNTSRHDELVRQGDALRSKLYSDQVALAELKGQQARLQAVKDANDAMTPSPAAGTPAAATSLALSEELAGLKGRITTLEGQNAATTAQINSLDTQASTAPPGPTLGRTEPGATLPAPGKILSTSVEQLLSKTVNSFDRPKLQASIVLDNFLQMQYEILSKQLTSLRDEVGSDHRILFLEMPTSIESADRRVWGRGGEDKLAQSWWRVSQILRRYKMEDSPCWLGDEFNEQFRYAGLSLGRPDYTITDTEKTPYGIPPSEAKDPKARPRFYSLAGTKTVSESEKSEDSEKLKKLKDLQDKAGVIERQYQELQNLVVKVNEILSASDDSKLLEATKVALETTKTNLRNLRAEFQSGREAFLASITPTGPKKYEEKEASVGKFESTCRAQRGKYGLDVAKVDELQSALTRATKDAKTADDRAKAKAVQELVDQIRGVLNDQLSDLLGIDQLNIYNELGGPKQIATAFISDVESGTSLGKRSGDIRSVDLIPRQTALNVNTAHALTRDSAVSFAWKNLFGFGLKVDYQRQHEQYDQFIQQEAFASAFGKGQPTFGWTFGPLPGSRVMNSGVRNTYAVLTVPDDATALALEGYGCSFNRKFDPPSLYPRDLDGRVDNYHCGNPITSMIEVPDRMNSGGFWLTDIDYEKAAAADSSQRVSMILRGSYFSPQTTVLVNGRRIPQVLGLGKPSQKMDSGADENAEDGVITGTFEYVNQKQLVLNLTLPSKYEGQPVITLIAPSRALTINTLRLHINGKFTSLRDEGIFEEKKKSDPKLTLTGWQYFGTTTTVRADLKGQKLADLSKVQLNGQDCTIIEKLNDSRVAVSCPRSTRPEWEFVAVGPSADDGKTPIASFSIPNPDLVSITDVKVLDGTVYDNDLHPALVRVNLLGTGFTPQTVLSSNTDRFLLRFVSSTVMLCEIRNPQGVETVTVGDGGQNQASIQIPAQKDKAKPEDPPKETTVTTVATEKTVTKK